MTIAAEQYRHVIGVDTHARTHTYAVLDAGTEVLKIACSHFVDAVSCQRLSSAFRDFAAAIGDDWMHIQASSKGS